jgi:NADH-quinone oxidoreductase subunit H
MNQLLEYVSPIIFIIFKIVAIILPIILSVAYLTLAERKIIGFMQLRLGPNVAGPYGLLQPIADAIKLLSKEIIIPSKSDKIVFILAPIITFVFSLVGWAVIPVSKGIALSNINVGIMYIMAISILGTYGIILAGWASNSRYAFFGSIRSAAQMISYELPLCMAIISVLLSTGSLNLSEIVEQQKSMPYWNDLLLMPMAGLFFICSIAETNRLPFDMPEAESELVAGYHVEYSSSLFALFFLGEYANMIMVSAMTTTLFLGGYLPPFNISFLYIIPGFIWFALKVSLLLFCFIWIRATLPRYRYDQLMNLNWKIFLPFSLIWLIILSNIIFWTR